jgi:nucleotide-binding universal stress UspA family protein
MTKHVLVPIDGSEQAQHALTHVIDEMQDVRVTLLHVINPAEAGYGAQAGIPSYSEEWYEAAREESSRLLDAGAERCEEAGIEVETDTEVGKAARTIADYAEEHDVDHVVIGSHGREGVSRILLGSVAEAVVRRSPVPVTVVR